MPCFHPLDVYRRPGGGVSFASKGAYTDCPLKIRCGQCIGCRLEYSRQWAVRCMHEASLHLENAFITLTYDDEHLPEHSTLVLRDFQLFMKRLRRRFSSSRFSFFHCGEYGELTRRPHYHALLFGLDFPDKHLHKRAAGGHSLYRSETLSAVWGLGEATTGAVTFESAAYVARYATKKITGGAARARYELVDADGVVHQLKPEYCTMSRRPAIGKRWIRRYLEDVYPSDEVIMRGHAMKPPRYYDKELDSVDQSALRQVEVKRLTSGNTPRARRERAPARLEAREKVARAKLNLYRGAVE